MTIDYQVRFANLRAVKETVTENEDGSYTIFIDSSLSPEAQDKAFKHAMIHIFSHDFEKSNVGNIEMIAHR